MKKRLLSIVLTLALCLGLLPTVSVPAAAAGTATTKAIQLGTSGISGYDSTNGYDYIYYGTWDSSAIKWRVLDDQTNTGESGLFLLSDVLLGTGSYGDVKFDNSGSDSNVWQNSSAQAWCKDFAGEEGAATNVTNAFTAGELGAVLATTKSDQAFTSSGTFGVLLSASENILNGDKVFFLSAEEAENAAYGFTNDTARVANYGASAGEWWLRSPIGTSGFDENYAGLVFDGGSVAIGIVTSPKAARPAFNLNLNSVLFTSAADNSGHNSSFAAPADYSGNEWKVTVKDDNDFSNGASFTGTTALMYGYLDTTLTINHAALSTLSADYTNVTAMLTDSSGELLYYGSISNDTSATSSTITIPAGLAAGEYTLSVYGEDWNGEKLTDYATGTPCTIEITVHEHSWATAWNSDSTHHWHNCENSGCPVTENSGKDGYAEHSFTVETVKDEALKSAANCTDPATYYKSCVCGVVSTSDTDTFESGSALSHSWATDWNSDSTHHWHECGNSDCPVTDNSGKDGYAEHSFTVETVKDEALKSAANCTDPATYYKSCVCGKVSTSDSDTFSGSVLGHDWGDWTSTNDTQHSRTCKNDGNHTESAEHSFDNACDTDCNDNCGYTRSTTHSYGTDWSKDASGHWYECSVCGDKKDNATHTPGNAATETTAQTCTVCGYEINPALGHTHNYGAWQSNGDGTHTRTCSTDSSHTENGNCSGGTATCKSPATCSDCGQPYGNTDSSNHTGGTEVRDKVDATTTAEGYTGDTYCLGCDTKIATGTTIPKKDSGGGGGGGYTPPSTPATVSVTVPISGDEKTIRVDASVKGDTATIDEVDLSRLDTVIGDDVATGTVTIDFSGVNSRKDITTVEVPSDVVKQIAEAVNNPANDAESLEVILSDGTSIEFDAAALGEKAAQADGLDITISIEHHEDAKLTNAQKNAVGNRPAYDISVTSGGKHISNMGGKITVHAPYELKPGEKARGIVVWYVDDHGNRERCETSYDEQRKRVNWKTDHLSLYMIDYDEALANNPFTDVAEDAYYYEAVLWAADSGITSGTGDGTTFSPDAPCTRGQMATFLWRAAGSPDPAGSSNPFTDVPVDAYYAKAVQWAYEQGITGGTSATTFSPDATCTRAQMATFLWRNAGTPATAGGSNPFTDVPADAYYTKAVQWAYEQEITGGTTTTTFSPDDPCTRAQMVTFLYRHFEN